MKLALGPVSLAVLGCLAVLPAQAVCPLPNPAACIYVDDSCLTPPGTGTQVDPFCTIQQGFNNAVALGTSPANPLTILVMPGTYNECLQAWGFPFPVPQDLPAKLIADAFDPLSPETSAALTTIDGAVLCANTPTVSLGGTGATLKGFRITGGGKSGVYAQGSVVITNNLITGNSSTLGGGIYLYTGTCYYAPNDVTASITDNIVRDNSANEPTVASGALGEGDGGGIFVWAREFAAPGCGTTSVTVQDNLVEDNRVSNENVDPLTGELFQTEGAGMYILTETLAGGSASVVVTQNTVTGNSVLPNTSGYGGGIWAATYGQGLESIEVSDNTVTDNSTTADGGGISAWILSVGASGNHSLRVQGNDVSGNTAAANGGGLDLFVFAEDLAVGQSVALDAIDNTVTSNTSGFDGGGVLAAFSSRRTASPTVDMRFSIASNEITGNTAGLGGGGAILLPFADGDDPNSDPSTNLCLIHLPATAEIEFTNNLVANNVAVANNPSIDIIGAGVLAIPASVGQGAGSVQIHRNTVADNLIDLVGFVGGIEIQADTQEDCCGLVANPVAAGCTGGYTGTRGTAAVDITSTIVSENERSGIGGPAPVAGEDLLTVTVERSYVFGHGPAPFANFETTLFPTVPPGNSQVNPQLNPAYQPAVCSPVFDSGRCATDLRVCTSNLGCGTCDEDASNAFDPCDDDTDCPSGLCEYVTACDQPGVFVNPDSNQDGAENGVDVLALALALGSSANQTPAPPDVLFDVGADLDGNGTVDGEDLAYMAGEFGEVCP